MNSSSDLPDCSNQCNSTQHGDIITSAISKRSVLDIDLCAFLNYICCRCESVVDSDGRTALHLAASCGRLDLVKWLVNNRRAEIDAKDRESGYTALHRSMFYGNIHVAVELIKLGASVNQLDSDGLTVLDHAIKDGLKPESTIIAGEVYSWGSNTNNLLGPQVRPTPELLDIFHKEYPREYVRQICINQFHTVIVTNSGKVLSCGHGQGGRLGLGDEKAVILPRIINFPGIYKGEAISCVQVSIARDHTIFLCSDGNIYTCGLNTYYVLGQLPHQERVLTPKPIKPLSKVIEGVCAGQYHSVAWGPQALFCWGLNAGQLGHKLDNNNKNQFIVAPKIVNIASDIIITNVSASNGATAVCTKKGDIYVLHEYLCRKIASRQLNIVQIIAIGGKLDATLLEREVSKELSRELKVAVLTNTGNILLWQESDQQLCRCIYSVNRAMIMKQISINVNGMLLVTDYGEAFEGFIKPRLKKKGSDSVDKVQKFVEQSAFNKFLEKEDCIILMLKKISRIHRAISIQSDLKGKDFCVIQAYPYKYFELPKIPESQMKTNFQVLIAGVNELDGVHDILIKIGERSFPAHKFILSTESQYLSKLISEANKELVLNNIDPNIFEQFLKFIYIGECDLTKSGELKNESLRKLCAVKENKGEEFEETTKLQNMSSNVSAFEYYSNAQTMPVNEKRQKRQILKNPVRMLHELAKKFEYVVLQKILSNLDMENYVIERRNKIFTESTKSMKFDRLSLPNLYDIVIRCRDDKEISAHKCIMAARSEYFNNMFSMRWQEEKCSKVTLPFLKVTVEALLEFLYTDAFSYLDNMDSDQVLEVLVLADQLFVTRLKEHCELLLAKSLTLKNAIHMLSCAHLYNAEKLKKCCLKFIVLNITSFLEQRCLDELEDGLLKELSDVYFQEKQNVICRVITPYSTAVEDEVVVSIGLNHPVSLKDKVEIASIKSGPKKKSRSHKNSNLEKRNPSLLDKSIGLDSVVQFPDTPEEILHAENDLENIPIRLRSIKLASEIIKTENIDIHFSKLHIDRKRNPATLHSSLSDSADFPELNSPPIHLSDTVLYKSPSEKNDMKFKIAKLSQKQRKKLLVESNHSESPPLSEPKNPWKTIADLPSPILPVNSKHTIDDIISDEKKQKENLVKITSKLLVFTQMEDKAIEELHKFYNSENIADEIIEIERVNIGAIAPPVWVPRTK